MTQSSHAELPLSAGNPDRVEQNHAPRQATRRVRTDRFSSYVGNMADVLKTIEHLKRDSLTSGWTSAESGPCCKDCELRDEHFNGRADFLKAACDCRNPFQVEGYCQCHIPTRKAARIAVNRRIDFILELLRALCVQGSGVGTQAASTASQQPESEISGEALKQAGIARVSGHNKEWMQKGIECFEDWFDSEGTFTGEDIRLFGEKCAGYFPPTHPNAWGALIGALVSKKLIQFTGEYRTPKDRSSHCRAIKVYREFKD